jgi:hypothetical protein
MKVLITSDDGAIIDGYGDFKHGATAELPDELARRLVAQYPHRFEIVPSTPLRAGPAAETPKSKREVKGNG